MATILTKKKDTTGAPSSGDLTNSSGGAELAVNTADKRLYTKDSGGSVVEVGINPTSITTGTLNTSGAVVFNDAGANVDFRVEGDTEANLLFVDASAEAVGIGTSSPESSGRLTLDRVTFNQFFMKVNGTEELRFYADTVVSSVASLTNPLLFETGGTERMRIDASGSLGVGQTPTGSIDGVAGATINPLGYMQLQRSAGNLFALNRTTDDGNLVEFYQAGAQEGAISVSGSTVTYGGGHLARFGQLPDGSKDESLKKGTVLSNLDEMCVWSAPTTYWTEEDELPVDEEGNPTVAVGDVKKEAFIAENEQCNKIKISDIEGDANVAGVFVSWTYDEQFNSNDLFVAMTGDMIIRIAQGVTVARGDLLMSAGNGTAKPQGDDIVRSKTVAKVTSTHVTCTYDDGSFCVPCVLMAC